MRYQRPNGQRANSVTEQMLEQYPFQIRPLTGEEGGGYLIEFPDVPGCMSDGETPEEAIPNGRDALKCYLLTMKELGEPIPEPGSFKASSELDSTRGARGC
jgi:predicted RNase H-like HicB family nuclease